ncbi:MAG: DUF2292 domain-containing protein [Methylobacter sp.]|nr:DUF2292 domain-containing protein [Methylobacter sp.]MDP2100143.1 DUF2292 domain-containing protein [Methylobacter sp.]MDP2428437.1 DUF2292 domain-containing protein [Methylobacter sp.]MDP3054117.1 DUF2292 domain-containing protein [Methylobacter sp.]MDP3362814.1 DUF2292 domain-containing protein [Methylobacter sp.]
MASDTRNRSKEQQVTEISRQIASILQDIKFGSIEITIHENKVVQIERKEKLRFDSK